MPTPGATFGRYRIRELLGAGGMGAVFLADDPLLDRTVAVKILRSGATDRLLEEGRVMAKLNHPNVIHVYDVGIEGETAFVAMEHIRGTTLRTWLDGDGTTRRTLAEIVDAFAQAGRGLAAAHAAGLVHRDFTLTNVMITADGRVIVTDFGLAVPTASGSSERSGTPAFMSPEQIAGMPIDLRSDVFSFCVAMWRAVFREPPFPGETVDQLAQAMKRGAAVEPKDIRRVPRPLRLALERGLQVNPDDRWPGMDALVTALLGRRKRIVAVAALATIAVALGVTAFVLTTRSSPHRDPCQLAPDRYAGAWDDPARAKLEAAYAAIGDSKAPAMAAALGHKLDDRLAALDTMRAGNCTATEVRRDQSDTAFDLRSACLDGKLAEITAFVRSLDGAPAPVLLRAQDALSSVGDVATCGDATALARRMPLPSDPARRASIATLDRDVVAANTSVVLGIALPDDQAAALVERARRLAYPPTLAFALLVAGRSEQLRYRPTKAEALYDQALLQADAGGDDARRFDIEIALGRLDTMELDRFDDGRRHFDRANALVVRIGTSPQDQADLFDAMALLELRRGRLDEAEKLARQAIASSTSDELARATHLDTLGSLFLEGFRPQEALPIFNEAVAIDERVLGPTHPRTARDLMGRGGTYRQLSQFREALADLERGEAIMRRSFGDDHFNTGVALANLGIVYDSMKKFDDAERNMRRAYDIYKQTYGVDHSRTMRMLMRIGYVQAKARHDDAAEATLLAALDGLRKVYGDNHRQVADAYYELGHVTKRKKQLDKAVAYFEHAAASLSAAEGPTTKLLRRVYKATGDVHGDQGKWAVACKDYEKAIAVAGIDETRGQDRGDLEFEYANALYQTGDRDRSYTLAKTALDRFVAIDDEAKTEVAGWLKTKFPGR